MSRLPTVGGDTDAWGTVLNDFLAVAHNADGTLAQPFIANFGHSGVAAVGQGTGRFLFPHAVTVLGVVAAADTAPTGSSLIVDVNKNGTTMFTTQANRPAIAAGQHATSVTAVPDVTSVAAGDYLSVDIDQVGATIAGSDLTVAVFYR